MLVLTEWLVPKEEQAQAGHLRIDIRESSRSSRMLEYVNLL